MRALSFAMEVSKSTVQRWLKHKEIRRHSSAIKPYLWLGVDEKALVSVLGKWNPKQRQSYRKSNREFFKEDERQFERWDEQHVLQLRQEFLRLKDAVVLYTLHPWERDARLLKEALVKGPQFHLLIETACTRPSDELFGARRAYHSLFEHSIEEDIAFHIQSPERKLLVALVSSYRYEGPKVHEDIAKSEAKVLADAIKPAGGKSLVGDEEIVRILATRSKLHLMSVYKYYKDITGKLLDEDLNGHWALKQTVQCLCTPQVYFSKVFSVKLDEWTHEQVDMLNEMGGNNVANLKYEAARPESTYKKPKPDSSIEERSDFIRRKYELQQFVNSDLQLICPATTSTSSSEKKHSSGHRIHGLGHAFRNSWRKKESEQQKGTRKSNSTAGMVEFIGLIKVNVVRGTNLAIRDMVSSDPYVILSLGSQSVKTRVIKNNLNPVWNEQLMLSIPENIPPLKVHVFDKDTFTTDDFMGEAEIDIQPLVSAARACESSSNNETMQLGTWKASQENTLVADGVISLVEGTVKQVIALKLLNVERGVLEVELECVSLSQ
ncbi:unnamed protein product [Cuscuta campestris]|uniref:C2 domain-containing protein n=1 Tax=Cuscuta campestris TaxID=132261 RepID=A0A484MVX8_9ASTE|nr:unnamed protein product [Cuscuta campestris]